MLNQKRCAAVLQVYQKKGLEGQRIYMAVNVLNEVRLDLGLPESWKTGKSSSKLAEEKHFTSASSGLEHDANY